MGRSVLVSAVSLAKLGNSSLSAVAYLHTTVSRVRSGFQPQHGQTQFPGPTDSLPPTKNRTLVNLYTDWAIVAVQ